MQGRIPVVLHGISSRLLLYGRQPVMIRIDALFMLGTIPLPGLIGINLALPSGTMDDAASTYGPARPSGP